ncbi:unnamed protein product [Zymoseptoria tritici ST99CH_3D1]|nr:unnamed protein product [Zymoseptoria tritici ST99CH_3D1]
MADTHSDRTINVLLATFAGLGLPRTLSLPTKASSSIGDVYTSVLDRLPHLDDSLIISTVSNKQLSPSNDAPITTLLSSSDDSLLSLRLSRRLCGGKGGFGSQLRAAGGRMSSRKNRDRNQNPNGSNRNLDGRRLRTVDEAKRLAEYLAIKPEMEKREKDERKKRWEAVVEAAERKEEEIRSGKAGANSGRLNAEYVESKELAEEKTREAVLKAMRELQNEGRTGSESSEDVEEGSDEEDDDGGESSGSSENVAAEGSAHAGRTFFGWDDEDEDDSEDDEEETEIAKASQSEPAYNGKGVPTSLTRSESSPMEEDAGYKWTSSLLVGLFLQSIYKATQTKHLALRLIARHTKYNIINTDHAMALVYNYAPPTLVVDHPHDRLHQHNSFLGVLARRNADPKAHPNYADMDILDTEDLYRIDIEVPGVHDPSSIKLQWENWRFLVVSGETKRSWEIVDNGENEMQEQRVPDDQSDVLNGDLHRMPAKTGLAKAVGEDKNALHRSQAHIHDRDGTQAGVYSIYPRLPVEERRIGSFRREIHFDVDVEMGKLKAKLQAGLLTIELPKKHYECSKGRGEVKVETG